MLTVDRDDWKLYILFSRNRDGPPSHRGTGDGITKMVGGGGIVPAGSVPRIQLEEKIQEVLSRDETIQVSNSGSLGDSS